jgi:RimJ/RimL family protein N-acetyltransferase
MFGVSRNDVRPITKDGAARWVQKLIDHPYAWVIEAHGKLIGEIRLDNVDLHDRRASMVIGIFDPELLGRGLGSEAILLLLQHAFAELRLHRVGIRVLAYNQRAIRAYEKCGFIVEGREREALVNGAWHDDACGLPVGAQRLRRRKPSFIPFLTRTGKMKADGGLI